MPAAAILPFVGPIMGGVGSIMGGVKGAGASQQAGNLQYQAAQDAIKQFRDMLNQYNPPIQTAADEARAAAVNAATTAGQGITGAATSANQFLAPYVQGGAGAEQTLANFMQPGGQFMTPFTAENMQQLDPGYQFRIDQANRALAASAAARGGSLGGGVAQALQAQSQNLASAEMQNAFNRFYSQRGQQYGMLSDLAARGLTAGNISGANLMNAAQLTGNWGTAAAQYGGTAEQNAAARMAANAIQTQGNIANLLTGGAAARGAGIVGGANAFNAALGGLGNAATQAGNIYMQQQGMTPPNFTPYSAANQWNPAWAGSPFGAVPTFTPPIAPNTNVNFVDPALIPSAPGATPRF
ncbi:MAG: hypothetical protein C5B60_08840 [Chloroflexi bacterium]|nr:MAG: hypothetical protein C5B60_08840 [Chloroflexota bacterium]